MAVFTYQGKASDGKKMDGVLQAPDRAAAQAELRKRNIAVTTLAEKKKAAAKGKGGLFGMGPRAKPAEVSVFTRQLSTMISAGIPLLEALEILHEQSTEPGFRIALDRIIDKVRSGSDFSTALSDYPRVFSKIYVNMVKAGEASGQLDTILNRLAEYLEATEELKREIKAAMTYPVVSLCLITAITIGLVVGVVPKFKLIFEQLQMKELPAPTEILLKVSDWMKANFILFILGMIVLIVAFIMYTRTAMGRKQWHWVCFHMPVFGPLFRKVAISRFARTFATLIQSGVPMLGALDIVAGTAGNVLVEDAVLRAKEAVARGETLGDPLAATKIFPPMVTRMIAIGEKTGAIEKLLLKISEFYDQEVRATVKALTSLIEPIMIATMGCIVAGIVLSIFLPILKIQQQLTGG
ncbi:MAG: type II secretion system F family protein [Planctomycetes bacterium]|nr:type II secretion system F family protein [Planctomycetota bacterium]